MPASARSRLDLVPFRRALELLHRPEKVADFKRAQDALRYREAFVLQTALVQRRIAARRTAATPAWPPRVASSSASTPPCPSR